MATEDGAPTRLGVHRCIDCRYYNFRQEPELFSPSELQTPGGLKAHSDFQEQQKQHAMREEQLLASGRPFLYEPHHHAWCSTYTRLDLVSQARDGSSDALEQLIREGGAMLNPVNGELTAIYALCSRMNPRGMCEKYEPR